MTTLSPITTPYQRSKFGNKLTTLPLYQLWIVNQVLSVLFGRRDSWSFSASDRCSAKNGERKRRDALVRDFSHIYSHAGFNQTNTGKRLQLLYILKIKITISSTVIGLKKLLFPPNSIINSLAKLLSDSLLKGPSQPLLCFCLHPRLWLLYFIRSMSKRRRSL